MVGLGSPLTNMLGIYPSKWYTYLLENGEQTLPKHAHPSNVMFTRSISLLLCAQWYKDLPISMVDITRQNPKLILSPGFCPIRHFHV